MDLIVIPSSPLSNSFVDLGPYKEFILNRVPPLLPAKTTYAQLVTLLSGNSLDEALKRSLVAGTGGLCRLVHWKGTIYDPLQALCFGRTGLSDSEGREIPGDIHPSQIVNATCEYSWKLYNGFDTTKENAVAQLGLRGVKAGSLAVDFYESAQSGFSYQEVNINPDLWYMKLPASVLSYIPADWYYQVSVSEVINSNNKKKPVMFFA